MNPSGFRLSPQNLDRLQRLTLYDDRFMNVVLGKSIPCTERILRIVYNNPELTIVDVQLQKHEINLERKDAKGRNAIMDIVACDTNGCVYNLEIQVKHNDNLLRRARYYGDIADTQRLREGEDYQALPEFYITFLTKTDYFEKKKPLYAFETKCDDLSPSTNTGVHITFVNGAHIDDSPLGRLMHDMRCANPDEMYYKELRERCAFLKRTSPGRLAMTGILAEIFDEGKEEGLEEGREEGLETGQNRVVLHMMKNTDLTDEHIVQYTGISLDTIQKLRKVAESEVQNAQKP